MPETKIACLGAGSLYFPRALGDLVCSDDLAGSEIVLYDLCDEKAERMAAMGTRLTGQARRGLTVRATSDLADAIDGAHAVITSIGGSGGEITPNVYTSCYHNEDMHIAARYGIHQVVGDTAGPAGMMMGLRAIPAYLAICREMDRRCPDALLLSHSNPMGVLCRAMNKYSRINVAGICHGVQATIQQAADMLDLPAAEIEWTWIGTNHYYWIIRAEHNGCDVTDRLMRAADALGAKGSDNLAHRLSRIYGHKVGYPGAGHLVEFYTWGSCADSQERLPYGLVEEARAHGFDERTPMPVRTPPTEQTRGAFFKEFQQFLDNTKLPSAQAADHVSEEGIARLIAAAATGRQERFIVNVPNAGTVENLPAEAVIETWGTTDGWRMKPAPVGSCPTVLKGILEKRFAWQETVVDAAVSGDRRLALQAVMLDETVIHPDRAEEMLDELLDASRDLLPQFFDRD